MKTAATFLFILFSHFLSGQRSVYIDDASDKTMADLFEKILYEDPALSLRVKTVGADANPDYTITLGLAGNTSRYAILVTEGPYQTFIGAEENLDPAIFCPRKSVLRQFLFHNPVSKELFGEIEDRSVINAMLSNDLRFKIYTSEGKNVKEVDRRSDLYSRVKNKFYIDDKRVKMAYNSRERHWVLTDSTAIKQAIDAAYTDIKIPGFSRIPIDVQEASLCNTTFELKLKKGRKVFGVDGFKHKEYLVIIGGGLLLGGAGAFILYNKAKNDFKSDYSHFKTAYDLDAYYNARSVVRKQRQYAIISQTLISVGASCTLAGFILKRK